MPRQSPSRNYRCGKSQSKLNVIWLKSMSLIVEQSLFIVQKYCQFFSFSCTVFVVALLPLPPICLCFLFHQGVIKVAASKFPSLAAAPQCDVIFRSALLKRQPITLKNSANILYILPSNQLSVSRNVFAQNTFQHLFCLKLMFPFELACHQLMHTICHTVLKFESPSV